MENCAQEVHILAYAPSGCFTNIVRNALICKLEVGIPVHKYRIPFYTLTYQLDLHEKYTCTHKWVKETHDHSYIFTRVANSRSIASLRGINIDVLNLTLFYMMVQYTEDLFSETFKLQRH